MTETLDRKKAPEFHQLTDIAIQRAVTGKLDNGIDVYSINAGTQELIKIEFLFKAGMIYQSMPLLASAANNLIETGTSKYSAKEISDKIDYYGAFLELQTGQDFSYITLYSLNKFLEPCVEVLESIIKDASYPKKEFDLYIKNKRQKFLVNSQKVSVLARRHFNEMLFGPQHPYGREVQKEDFDNLPYESVKTFYSEYINPANCTIVVSGMVKDEIFQLLNKYFGNDNWNKQLNKPGLPELPRFSIKEKHQIVEKSDAIQSAIRVGKVLFNKTHPDYFHFQVLNTVLGGYFGSRLMANIREDKGYTYGIGSGLVSLVNAGYFFISTEVGADVTQKALDEIYFEIKQLRETPIGKEELTTVKNYILGQFLRSVDGPFALADKFKAVWMFGLDYDYFDNFFQAVNNVTSEELMAVANKHLQEADLLECVAGKK